MEDLMTGKIGRLVGDRDWSQTALGDRQTWSQELKAAVRILVTELDRAQLPCQPLSADRRYDALWDSIDQGFCVCDLIFNAQGQPIDYRFLEVNHIFEAMTGLERAEGKTALELIPNLEHFWIKTYGEVVQTRKSIRFENYASAMERWFDVNAFPIDEFSKNKFGLLFTDISDRKRQELNSNFLAEIQKDLATLSDRTEIMGVVGEKIRNFFGLSLVAFSNIDFASDSGESFYNNRDADIFDTVATHRLSEYFSNAHIDKLKTGEIVAIDDVTADPDIKDNGAAYLTYQVYSVINVPYLSDSAWKFLITGSRRNPSNWRIDEKELIRELTARIYNRIERARAETALKKSEKRYRNLVELIPQLVWTATPEGLLLDVNQRWLDFTGLAVAQAKSKGWQAVIYADDLPMMSEYWQLAQQEGKYKAEGRILQADGKYRWHLHQAIPIKNDRGEITKWFGTATDIDHLKQLEQQNNDLLAKLQERNQELDQFTYIAAHDLKAPLRAIANLSQWLEDDISDLIPPENQEHLKLMRSRVFRMEALINGLLDYARIGRAEIGTDLVSIEDLLAEIIDSLDPPPTFRIEVGSALPTFCTKRILLNQVLANLIGNAIKHHDRADGRISISVEQSSESYPGFYKFVIADDGKGIDPQMQKRIFAIFQTLDGHNSDSTGIGLAIVQKIVESQGGSVWVESSLGEGSAFSFTWR